MDFLNLIDPGSKVDSTVSDPGKMNFFNYFAVIAAFLIVILLLLFTTKYLAYKSKKMLKGNYMQIVETLSLGVNNRLHLIKIDREFFVISATGKSVEFLARVNISDFEEEELKNPISEVIDFKSVLKKYVGGFGFANQEGKTGKDTGTGSGHKSAEDGGNNENTNVETFKKNLNRLRDITDSINNKGQENEKKNEN